MPASPAAARSARYRTGSPRLIPATNTTTSAWTSSPPVRYLSGNPANSSASITS